MKKKLIAAFIAVFLLLSCTVSAFAVGGLSIFDFLQFVSSVDSSKYTEFNQQEWETMSPAERAEQFNYVITDQRGSSNITESSDFINDSDLSYKYYCGLINNSPVNQGLNNNLWSKTFLEGNGLADFGMGYYYSNGHSSGKFGDGTVADTLNDEFLDYLQDNLYPVSEMHKLSSGDYYFEYGAEIFSPNNYGCQAQAFVNVYYKDSLVTKLSNYSYFAGYPDFEYAYSLCKPRYDDLIDNMYYDDSVKHIHHLKKSCKEFCFDLSKYILDDVVEIPDSLPAVGVDDSGNRIDLNIDSGGVTYEGNTYQIDNSDHSVTIDGNKYYITVNPSDVDEDYYNQFLQQIINNYYNYYNTDSTPFDDTDILTAVKSVFTSLETFRSYCYSQLKQLTDYISDGFNSMRSSFKTVIDTLKDILKQVKEINKSVGELTEEQEEKNKSDWADLISDFKNKVGWSTLEKSMDNIQTSFFGKRKYFLNSSSGEIQVQIMQKNAEPLNSSMPELSITYMGQSYNLYSLVPYFESDIEPIKQFISLFLWVGFILAVFRSIPSILGGVVGLQKNTHFMSGDGD